MIEALKSDDLVYNVGGRFKLVALIQRRLAELLEGARPMVERKPGMTDVELVVQEIMAGKVAIDYENSDVPAPETIIKRPEHSPAAGQGQ
jgi:DNA-directed RNA polymerase subunit omega